MRSFAWEAEDIGWKGIVKKIRETVGENPVYSEFLLSLGRGEGRGRC